VAQQSEPAPATCGADPFQSGVAAVGQGDFEHALTCFREALVLLENPAVRYNIASCLDNLGRLPEARNEMELYLSQAQVTAARRQQVQQRMAVIGAQVGLLELDVTPDGASVTIDGNAVEGVAPFSVPWAVSPGGHQIEVTLEGYQPHDGTVSVGQGATRTVDVPLEPIPPPPPVLPPPPPPPPTERHRLSPAWFGATLGLAAALAVGGIATGALALQREEEFPEQLSLCQGGDRQACGTGRTIAEEGEALGHASTGLFISSGVVAAAAFVLIFFTEWRRDGGHEASNVSWFLTPMGMGRSSHSGSGFILDASIGF
jgi:hypothetical protein